MNDQTLISYGGYGGSVKALGDGRFEAPLVQFGDESRKDLVGDFFTKETDYWAEFPAERPLLYAHALDKTLKSRRLGGGSAKLELQDAGVWMQGQLDMADEYQQHIYKLIEAGKMGTSSGSASHLVEREKKAAGAFWVKSWPIVEASLTPTPCEPRNFGQVLPLKSLPTLLNPWGDASASGMPDEQGQEAALMTDISIGAASRLLDRLTSAVYANLYNDGEPLSDRMDAIRTSAGQFADLLVRACEALMASGDAAAQKGAAALVKTLFIDRTCAALPAGVTLSEEWDGALAALTAVSDRTRQVNAIRVKDGRVLSSANRDRIKQAMDILTALYAETEPGTSADEVMKALERFEATRLRISEIAAL